VGALESLAYVAPYPKDIRRTWSTMASVFEEAKGADRDSYEAGLGAMAVEPRAKLESLDVDVTRLHLSKPLLGSPIKQREEAPARWPGRRHTSRLWAAPW
jgi:hypothetical protein